MNPRVLRVLTAPQGLPPTHSHKEPIPLSDPRSKIIPTAKDWQVYSFKDGGAYEFYRDTGFLRTTGLRQKLKNLLLVPYRVVDNQAVTITHCKEVPDGITIFTGPRWRYNRLPRGLRILHALESIEGSTGLPMLG